MPGIEHSEFEIKIPPVAPEGPPRRREPDDSVLGLRRNLERYYGQLKKLEQRSAQREQELAKDVISILLDMIRIADAFEDVFRMAEENSDMAEHKMAVDAFRIVQEALIDILEKRNVHQVPIMGKAYQEVEFEGVKIADPWKVVAKKDAETTPRKGGKKQMRRLLGMASDARQDESGDKDGRTVVRKVLRPLWVLVRGNQVVVLRRAQVAY